MNPNVRLTKEAHALLAEMADDCETTMKEIASEAITRAVHKNHDDSRFALGAFVLGAIVGGVLMFFVGLVI